MSESLPILSVSDFLAFINQTLDYAYGSVIVEGEVSSFKVAKNRYVYFDLKDETGSVNCFMTVYQLRTPIEDGMRVRVHGTARVTSWGKFSLTARAVMPVGEGALQKAFALLKAKLSEEGLFEESRKRPLPPAPESIAVVASHDSAGLADFLKILQARWGGLNVTVIDVMVQGVRAPEQITQSIEHLNQQSKPADVVVVIRGGGSADDLAAFSTEPVVRAIAGSRIPTLVAIGHETDVSLAELAADVRASTPSNAAELLVPDKKELTKQLTRHSAWLQERETALLNQAHQQVALQLANLQRLARFEHLRELLALQTTRLERATQQVYTQAAQNLGNARRLLESWNPRQALQRGYALVRAEKGLVRDPRHLKIGQLIVVELAHGQLQAKVTDIL